ncbi:hypothetical protein [Streptomyces rochei]|uniref:hypothetical protein n=1 Tax=Streptomyces rochei TaxID=1928 RepID=UPI0036FAFA8E
MLVLAVLAGGIVWLLRVPRCTAETVDRAAGAEPTPSAAGASPENGPPPVPLRSPGG